ncbi:MAG TPA: 3-deoxy-manno-octulosonate cytidylyltransferase [Anaeromyxobacteraceae bacterium]|nr:3-deoxy-manno-octulosonate cytidylyltransferase [Anaeromyxobacteraceae bacterium]
MRRIALIPARLGATRFPRKLLAPLGGKTVIRRTFEAVRDTGLFDAVMVVTDSDEIRAEVERAGGEARMSRREHESGTDRIAEVVEGLPADLVLNVQGDEPFTRREPLERLLAAFDGPEGRDVGVASLMQELSDPELIRDPNYVKVVVDAAGRALFFSRAPIPYVRDPAARPVFWEHIGVYAFRREALLRFARLPAGPLERAEKVECLRFLEHGIRLRMVATDYMGVEIDTPEDLRRAERLLAGEKG